MLRPKVRHNERVAIEQQWPSFITSHTEGGFRRRVGAAVRAVGLVTLTTALSHCAATEPSDDITGGRIARPEQPAATQVELSEGEAPLVLGEPLEGEDRRWNFVPFPGTRCQDGSTTGLGVSLSASSQNVLIYLQPGGACFDERTCADQDNAAPFAFNRFGITEFSLISAAPLFFGDFPGVFARNAASNPFRDWNHVFVPYCSGDVHFGQAPQGAARTQDATPRPQLGAANMRAFLARLVPTFGDARQIVLAGSSAGGFGALLNYPRVQAAFGDIPVTAISDGSPPLRDAFLAPCLQTRWRELWNFAATFPSDCSECVVPQGTGGLYRYLEYLSRRYPDRRFAVLADDEDAVMRDYYAYGDNGSACAYLGAPLPAATFRDGVEDLLAQVIAPLPNFFSYVRPGEGHTFLLDPLDDARAGQPLSEWLRDLLQPSATPRSLRGTR